MAAKLFRPSFRRLYLGLGASIALYYLVSPEAFESAPWLPVIPFAVAVLAAVIISAFALLTTYSYKYTIGEEELVSEQGIINRTTRSVPIANIDNITVERPLSNILLGVGTICIDTPGGTGYELVLRHVEVGELRQMIDELKSRMKEERDGGHARTPNRGG